MAAPTYTTDLVAITLADTIIGWSALGGGASGLGTGADFAMQGTLCVDKQVTASEKGQIYNNGTTITPSTNTHFFVWVFLATPGVANTLANRGLGIVVGTGITAYNTFHVEGSDTYGAAGRVGKCYPIRYVTSGNGSAPFRTLTGSPGANPQYFGATTNITAAVKSANLGVDAIRYGTGVYITAGDSGNPATFTGVAETNDIVSNRWGILSKIGGSFELQGRLVIGQNSSGTPTLAYLNVSNANVAFVDTAHSLTDFTQVIIDHASTQVYITNCTFQALGTNNPGRFIVNNTSTIVQTTGCTFANMGISTLRAGVVANNCIWRASGQIAANSATITNSTINSYSGATDTSALVWGTAVDTHTKLNGTTFIKGTGTTHALELGITSPTSITLTDVEFAGYNAANSQNDSAIYVKRTTGTVTINIIGGTNPSYKSDGATVVIVAGAVTTQVLVTDTNATPIENARVLVETLNGTGTFPYRESVTITRSGATATVTHTAHNMTTNDKVVIRGATQIEYNGIYTITVTGVNSYTYTVSGTPATPATGTIISSFVAVEGLTNVSGIVSSTRTYPTNQPIRGTIRKSTTIPYYRTSTISGTINTTSGFSTNVQLIEDQ